MDETQTRIDQIVKSSDVVLFMKGNANFPQCGFSGKAIAVLKRECKGQVNAGACAGYTR